MSITNDGRRSTGANRKRKRRKIQRVCCDEVMEYTTLQAASKAIEGSDTGIIKRALDGKQPSAYGYRWRWVEE